MLFNFIEINLQVAFELTGLVLGLVYLYYEYMASRKVWIFAMILPCVSMYVYYKRGVYADFGINIYYLITAIYGAIVWSGGKNGKAERKISHASLTTRLFCGVAAVAFWCGIYFVLSRFTNSNVPIPDAFTTALSMVGCWMLARKYIEQWIVWIIVDSVSVGLFLYKEIYPYALLYLIYTIVACFGYRKWSRLMAQGC